MTIKQIGLDDDDSYYSTKQSADGYKSNWRHFSWEFDQEL